MDSLAVRKGSFTSKQVLPKGSQQKKTKTMRVF